MFRPRYIFFVCTLLIHTEAAYSATEYTSAMADVLRVVADASHVAPASIWTIFARFVIIATLFSRCFS